ncbi:MAG TPA: transglutaminase family protein, partial [Mycobacterium sp.]|uniref:transglutaminase family protein n=1 Tax=Mycobacterium sp. TaxID=1785 RepID=UPI002C0AE74F
GKDTAAGRAELLARLDESTEAPTAFVLPLHRRDDDGGWASADWRLRRGRIVLVDGDSPAGLRLPLNAISWKPPRPRFDTDPTTVGDELHPSTEAAEVDDDETAPTTAMVAEVRDGLLYVFMPPTEALDHFVDLIGRVHDAAAKTGCPVVIEGYDPPPDPRLTSTTITPDPGVIEVNIAPTASFAEQSRQLETLYEEARLARLSTESFQFDGSHSGTGGGNHITLGGITPKDSPLLRRPDLLVSLLTYWQRHPALSYLFAGRFVGTTSQAPRVDEGRAEALYELEIAFAEIDRITSLSEGAAANPWVTDRALRHLLTDITGNTHRAEFCIDKLYNPDSPRGRLGLLELRGFEMPPHLRMAMVQSLLVRSLVAWFWDEPLRAPLIRHGPNLHGRYLLPHFLIHDIADVAADLRAHGIAFETNWLDPFTEFRFPRIGTAVFDGVEIELRGAIEPWNTLGEQSTATGTARYVDSSIERIQVRIIGADRHRYLMTCNGYPVPLLATDNPDVHVGGVRFRAWQPPSALHPSITVDGPLQFELVDLTTSTSRGGCTYHIAHPGGRAYDEPPVNAVEAESRRARRFEATGFTPGKLELSDVREMQARISTDIGAPGILDLRRVRTVLR